MADFLLKKGNEANISWRRQLLAALRPYATAGTYVNYLCGDEGIAGSQAAHGTRLG
ncbi:hypothetical protein BN2476_520004 [Paraburkholderia piptadeniae]|uniref:Uncharacterized protein n=1 Tax=Paraburkholderia piptadeniae TaxID=1701573 RepID=A0A1N7SGP4_9BURK|nr:hypothetical protein [Paraburkholderia piptadeniae]SIT46577.1 hypothetical protein BN2476_520004 [Paraburkholderia piptadeniae]